MHQKIKRVVAGAAAAATLGTLGAVAVETKSPEPASAVAFSFGNSKSSNRAERVCMGFQGLAKCEYLNKGEWTELAWVGSVWVPANCNLYFGKKKVGSRKDKGYWKNIPQYTTKITAKLTCYSSW